jgi:hypothetical protein
LAAAQSAEQQATPVSTIVLGAVGGLALVLGGAACVRAYSPRPRDSADAAQPRVNPWRQNAPPSLFSSALLPYDARAESRNHAKPAKTLRFF